MIVRAVRGGAAIGAVSLMGIIRRTGGKAGAVDSETPSAREWQARRRSRLEMIVWNQMAFATEAPVSPAPYAA